MLQLFGEVAKLFYSSRSTPPINSTAAVGFRFWICSITRSRGSWRSCVVCFFDLCIGNLAYLGQSLASGEPPPLPLETQKSRWNISQKLLDLPLLNIPGLKGGGYRNVIHFEVEWTSFVGVFLKNWYPFKIQLYKNRLSYSAMGSSPVSDKLAYPNQLKFNKQMTGEIPLFTA